MNALPPCGLYRTRAALGDAVGTGLLVYFHNHGNPGPGVYLPSGWAHNKAQWHEHGVTLPPSSEAPPLEPLPAEGFYRVREPFDCCEKGCRTFEETLLVQLGYNASAEPILFVPEWGKDGLFV